MIINTWYFLILKWLNHDFLNIVNDLKGLQKLSGLGIILIFTPSIFYKH